MTLTEIITEVSKQNGNPHETSDWYTTLVNRAQRWLDTKIDHPKAKRTTTAVLSATDFTAAFAEMRALLRLWVTNSDGEMAELERVDYDELVEAYPEMGGTDVGLPVAFAVTPSADDDRSRNITFMPPSEDAYTLTALGLFFEPELSVVVTTSYWSVVYPEVLIDATLYFYYKYMNNDSNAKERYEQVMEGLFGVQADIAEEEAGGFVQLPG